MKIQLPTRETEQYVFLVLIHIFLGVVCIINPISRIYFLLALVYFVWRIIMSPNSRKAHEILLGCAYFCGSEVLFRMTDGGISYESSKYLVILFMIIGMFYKGIKGTGWPYFMYLILLVPAILVASTTLSFDANFRTRIAFVLSGPVCLGLSALFCYERKFTYKELLQVINYMALPCIATTAYLFIYNPSVKDVLSGTSSNAAASGGFGPNQVSTILGLGMFALVARIFLKSPSIFLKLFNSLLLCAVAYRAIVTFSRGGVLAAIIVIVAFLVILFFRSSARRQNEIIGSFLLFVLAGIITWNISANQTYGLIEKRYANEDAYGREKSDIATGRLDLFMEEIDGFLGSPFLGIGTGRVTDIRVEREGKNLPSHNEIGRLLSEHGIFGIIALSILLFKPLAFRTRNKSNIFFYAFLAFWFATINHSAMRIAAPAFLYALSLITIINENPTLHRKQLKAQPQ